MKLTTPNQRQRRFLYVLAFVYAFGGFMVMSTPSTVYLDKILSLYAVITAPSIILYFLFDNQSLQKKILSKNEKDPLFDNAVEIVMQYDRVSTSLLQRRLAIGYNHAVKLLRQLEKARIVGPADGAKPREVLINNANDDSDLRKN